MKTGATTTIILHFVLYIGLVYSNVVKFNKHLTPDSVVPFECKENWKKEYEVKSFNAADIHLTVENGFINLVPIDVCGELVGSNTPLESCPGSERPIIRFKLTAFEQISSVSSTVTIENGRNFCLHISPCELLALLTDEEVKTDRLSMIEMALTYSFNGYVKKAENFGPLDIRPSLKVSLIGSRLQLDNTSTSKFNETFIGSIAAIRHNSTCNISNCRLAIGGLEKRTSNLLRYTKGSNHMPECVWYPEERDDLYGIIYYFEVDNADKLPVDTEYEVVSTMNNEPPLPTSPFPTSSFPISPLSTSSVAISPVPTSSFPISSVPISPSPTSSSTLNEYSLTIWFCSFILTFF